MFRVIVLFLVLSLWVGGLTQPSGSMQPMSLHTMYEQCSKEDHDITPLDFVFEHLLNLEVIVNIFEGEHEYQYGDFPHEPFPTIQAVSQLLVALPNTMQFDFGQQPASFFEVRKYFIPPASRIPSSYNADIFRPPVA